MLDDQISAESVLPTSLEPPKPQPLQVGPYSFHVDKCSISLGDVYIELTGFEMTLVLYLARYTGTIVSKEELAQVMYMGQCRPMSNSLEVFVGRIRRKIDPHKTYKPIETVRSAGYRFRNDWPQTK